jgi:hypothetical protein
MKHRAKALALLVGLALASVVGAHQSLAADSGNGAVQPKKVGAMDVSKLIGHGDIGQKVQVDLNDASKPRSPAAIGKAIGSAAADDNRQAIEISCAPAGSGWCATGFVAACDRNKGGLSTNPDGSVTCSMPHVK